MSPLAYQSDCTAAIGRVINHDDTDTDRQPGSKLATGFAATCDLWRTTFGCQYLRAGVSYKGAPPPPLSSPPPPPSAPPCSLGQGTDLLWGGEYEGEEGRKKLLPVWQGSGRLISEVSIREGEVDS